MTNNTIKHDLGNSIVIIKSMAQTADPIIDRIASYCLEHKISITTPKQFEILKKAMKVIAHEGEKLATLYDKI